MIVEVILGDGGLSGKEVWGCGVVVRKDREGRERVRDSEIIIEYRMLDLN